MSGCSWSRGGGETAETETCLGRSLARIIMIVLHSMISQSARRLMTAPTVTVDEAQTLVVVTDGIGHDPVGVEKSVCTA